MSTVKSDIRDMFDMEKSDIWDMRDMQKGISGIFVIWKKGYLGYAGYGKRDIRELST